jgi:hypothetical protein
LILHGDIGGIRSLKIVRSIETDGQSADLHFTPLMLRRTSIIFFAKRGYEIARRQEQMIHPHRVDIQSIALVAPDHLD